MPRLARWFVGLAILVPGAAWAGPPPPPGGIPDDAPFVAVDPRVDGADSFPGEWTAALRTDDTFVDPTTLATPAGHFYYENKRDWAATSSSSNTTVYSGTTFFIAHDIFGGPTGLFASFRTNDAADWNYAKAVAPDGTVVECWAFGGFTGNAPPHADLNEPDDGLWITDAVGLGASSLIPEGLDTDLIDDRGFIVRKNSDPSTDRHWFPGDSEPGDPLWDWETYYGCFARAGFNQTFQSTGTDPDGAHAFDHEVYEWCFHGTVGGLPPPLECFEWRIEWVDPPKRAVVFFAPDFLIHLGLPPVPATNWPFLAGLGLVLVAGGVLVFRRRRPGRTATATLCAALAIGVAGCGGGNGGNKVPPPLIPLRIPPRNAVPTQPYAHQFQTQGQSPPFTYVLAPGHTLPAGLTLSASGLLSGVAPPPGGFDSFFDVFITDALSNTATLRTGLHVDRNPYVPIELVSLSLVSVSPIVVGSSGQEVIGAMQIRGGNAALPYTFQLAPLNNLPAGLKLSPSGIVRGIPSGTANPTNPVVIHCVQGANPPVPLTVFFNFAP